MALFGGTILTNLGKQAIAQSLTGKQFEITKVVLGDGVWDNTNPEELTSLLSPKLTLPIVDKKEAGDTVRIRVLLTNEGLTEGFFIRELGVIAEDKTTGEEILYAVAYAEYPDYLPAGDGPTKVEAGFDVIVVVANSPNITVKVSDTIVLATKQDIETHNQSPEAHPDIRQAIQNLEEQISNIDEGITPNIEEAINQHNQDTNSHPDIRQRLEELQNQIDNIGEGITPDIQEAINQHNQDPDAHPNLFLKFIWRKETRNPTPDDVPPYDNALWLNLETGEIFVHLKTCNGKAFWKGQFGTIVTPSTVSVFDIFGDGSAIALWRFDGNLNDDGGRFNLIWDANEQYDTGKFGQAAKLDGSGAIRIQTDNPIVGSTLTFSGWFFRTNTNSTTTFFQSADSSSRQLNLWVVNGKYYVRIFSTTNNTIDIDTGISAPPANVWKHLVLTVDGINGVLKLYENTNLIFSTEISPPQDWEMTTFTLGGNYETTGHCCACCDQMFYGLIDQVRIFNRALTEDEVQILYNEMEVNC